jgi:type IV secretion system protein VirD4
MNKGSRKFLMANLPFFLLFYLSDKAAWLFRQMDSSLPVGTRIFGEAAFFGKAFANPLPSFQPADLGFGFLMAGLLKLFAILKKKERRNFRTGEEYGSASWGRPEDIEPYMDEDPDQNIILTKTEGMTLCGRPKNPKNARNKNVLVIGGSGSGKTRSFVKPNLMQMHSSYVVTDPKGTVLNETGKMLLRGVPKIAVEKDEKGIPRSDDHGSMIPRKDRHGKILFERDGRGKIVYEPYRIKVFNTINFSKSMHYNPFAYIRSEKDILKLVNTLIANTRGEGDKSAEDFWVKSEKLLYEAYIGYIWYEAPDDEMNFTTLLEFINASEVREDDETYKNAVDLLFEDLEKEDPNHFAVRMYKKYKLAAGKTAKSILISCGARLAPFDIRELRDITAYDEMELDLTGDRRTALFVIISDTDDTFNFLVSILYTQLFNLLCERADDVYGGKLPFHVRCLLDEFANIGQIPKFEKLIATIRSREISACIVLQAKSQLKAIYKDNAETIEGNCDSTLFLGGRESMTLKEMSEILGKETIDLYNTSDTRGQSRSYGQNFSKTGRDLMTKDELAVMDGGECILQIRGVRPFKSRKYDITQHKRYRLLSDYDRKNWFDIEKYLHGRICLNKADPQTEIETYAMEIDVPGEEPAEGV